MRAVISTHTTISEDSINQALGKVEDLISNHQPLEQIFGALFKMTSLHQFESNPFHTISDLRLERDLKERQEKGLIPAPSSQQKLQFCKILQQIVTSDELKLYEVKDSGDIKALSLLGQLAANYLDVDQPGEHNSHAHSIFNKASDSLLAMPNIFELEAAHRTLLDHISKSNNFYENEENTVSANLRKKVAQDTLNSLKTLFDKDQSSTRIPDMATTIRNLSFIYPNLALDAVEYLETNAKHPDPSKLAKAYSSLARTLETILDNFGNREEVEAAIERLNTKSTYA